MDGTGLLLEDFARALPAALRAEIVRYPPDDCGTYPEVDRFLRSAALDCEPFVLLAESFSTVAAIAWAASAPPNLRGLVLCVGFATPPVPAWLRPIYSLLSHAYFALPRPDFILTHWLTGRDAPRELIARVRELRGPAHTTAYPARIRAALACDVRAELARVAVPIFILAAQDDNLIGRARLDEMLRIRPDAEAHILPGPHLVLSRSPEQAAALVSAFTERCT